MSHIKSVYEEVALYLAAGNISAAFELINRFGLSNPREQVSAVRKMMKPADPQIGSNSFRYRRLLIRQAQRKAMERIDAQSPDQMP